MAVEMVDEMFRGLEDADREWRDEKREEVEYLWRAGIIPRNAQERPATARRFETDTRHVRGTKRDYRPSTADRKETKR